MSKFENYSSHNLAESLIKLVKIAVYIFLVVLVFC